MKHVKYFFGYYYCITRLDEENPYFMSIFIHSKYEINNIYWEHFMGYFLEDYHLLG